MHPDIAKLAELTEEASKLLLGCDEKHWGGWLADCAKRIRSLDFKGIEKLRGAFGGMGSMNDLLLHPLNGHQIVDEDVSALNDEWVSLRQQIWDLSEQLYREEILAVRRNSQGQ